MVEGADLEFESNVISFTDIQQFDESFSDTVQFLNIILAPRPHLNTIDLAPQTDDSPADLITLLQLLTHQRHREPAPTAIQELWVIFHGQDPFPSIRVRRVLPHGLDPRFEDVVVAVLFEFRGRLEPVEVAAEFFDGVEFADDGEACLVFGALGRVGRGEGGIGC